MSPPKPEELARERIDAALVDAGWVIQDYLEINLYASRGVAVREFRLRAPHGKADYLLYVDGKAAGVVEAKREGTTLTGVEIQTGKYSVGLPDDLPAHERPLPFLYESTGIETRFTSLLDPDPRSRELFHFHRPETLARWLAADPVAFPLRDGEPDPRSQKPGSFRTRLQAMPSLEKGNLWRAQAQAVRNLERSSSATARARSCRWRPGAGRPSRRSRRSTGSSSTPMRSACSSWSIAGTSASRRRRSSSSTFPRTTRAASPSSTTSSGSSRTVWTRSRASASARSSASTGAAIASAMYSRSGQPVRIDARSIELAGARSTMLSRIPRPRARVTPESVRLQSERTGVNAFWGVWSDMGNDQTLLEQLREIRRS